MSADGGRGPSEPETWVSSLDEDWHRETAAFEETIQEVHLAGPPGPPEELGMRARARLLETLASPKGVDALRRQAHEAGSADALATKWFADLGDPDEAPPSALLAMVLLADVAVEQTAGRRHRVATQEAAREEARRRELLESRLRRLVMAPFLALGILAVIGCMWITLRFKEYGSIRWGPEGRFLGVPTIMAIPWAIAASILRAAVTAFRGEDTPVFPFVAGTAAIVLLLTIPPP